MYSLSVYVQFISLCMFPSPRFMRIKLVTLIWVFTEFILPSLILLSQYMYTAWMPHMPLVCVMPVAWHCSTWWRPAPSSRQTNCPCLSQDFIHYFAHATLASSGISHWRQGVWKNKCMDLVAFKQHKSSLVVFKKHSEVWWYAVVVRGSVARLGRHWHGLWGGSETSVVNCWGCSVGWPSVIVLPSVKYSWFISNVSSTPWVT